MKKISAFVVFLLAFSMLSTTVHAAWYSTDYGLRICGNFSNANTTTDTYPIFLVNVTTNKSFVRSDCSDIIAINDTDNTTVPFSITKSADYCEARLTPTSIANQTNVSTCFYYNNSAANHSANWTLYNQTLLYDPTDGASVNTTFWTVSGTATAGGGWYNLTRGNPGATLAGSYNFSRNITLTYYYQPMAFAAANDNDWFETMFQSDSAMYRTGDNPNGYYRLLKNNGSWVTLAQTAWVPSAGVVYAMKVDFSNGSIVASINNTNFTVATDNTNMFGVIKVRAYTSAAASVARFKEIKVTSMAPQPGKTSYVGAEEALTTPGVGLNDSVTLSYPADGSTVTAFSVQFNYTPVWNTSSSFLNCSVWTNKTGSWAKTADNATAIVNATANNITYAFTDYDGAILYNIQCYNSTGIVQGAANKTFTMSVAKALNVTLTYPTAGLELVRNVNFTLNGTVNCTSGVCGNVTVYPKWGNASSGFVDDTNDEWFLGTFGAVDSMALTMNYSNKLILPGDLSSWNYNTSTYLINETAGSSWWYNESSGVYYVATQCDIPGGSFSSPNFSSVCGYNTTDLFNFSKYNSYGILVGLNASIPWIADGTYIGTVLYSASKGYWEMWIGGYNAVQGGGQNTTDLYANATSFGGPWVVRPTPVVNQSVLGAGCGDGDLNQMKVWLENSTYFATVMCTGPLAANNYAIWILNSTNGLDWNVMNGGAHVMSDDQFSKDEIQNNGIMFLPLNSTTNAYFQITGFWNGAGDAAETLTYSYDRFLTWSKWNNGADIIGEVGINSGRAGINDWVGFANGSIYLTYGGWQNGGTGWHLSPPAQANKTAAWYLSGIKDSLDNTTIWTSATSVNTTCAGCSVSGQIGISNNTSVFDYYSFSAALNKLGRYARYNITLTGNNTHGPEVSAVMLNTSLASTESYFGASPFITNVPYVCGVLNSSSPTCAYSFSVLPDTLGSYNFTVLANSTSVNNTSAAVALNVELGTVELNLSFNGILNANKSLSYGQALSVSGSGNDTNIKVYRDGVDVGNETILLGVGTYAYKINSTNNETGLTYYAIVSKASQTLTLSNNTSLSGTYPYPILITGSGNNTTAKLYRNGTEVVNPQTGLLGAGYWEFIFNSTSNDNFTAGSVTMNVTISKADSTAYLYLNGTAGNITYGYGKLNVTGLATEGYGSMYLNGSLIETINNPGFESWTNNTTVNGWTFMHYGPGLGVLNETSTLGGQTPIEGEYCIHFENSGGSGSAYSIINSSSFVYSGPISLYVVGDSTNGGEYSIGFYYDNTKEVIENGWIYSYSGWTNLIIENNSLLGKEVILFINGSRIAAPSGGGIYVDDILFKSYNQTTPIGVSNYTFIYSGNSNYTSSSKTFYANITPAGQSIGLSGITNGTYSYSVTPVCTGNVTANLYRDGAPATNNSPITLSAGTYVWTCNTTVNSNYTFATTSVTQVVASSGGGEPPATYPVRLYLNGTQGNRNYTYGQATYAYGTGSENVSVYRNGTNVGNFTSALNVGLYVIKVNSTNNGTGITYNATISKATPICTLSLNNPTYPSQANASCRCPGTDGTITMYRNGSDETDENNTLVNLAVGAYAYVCNSTATTNYNAGTASGTLTVHPEGYVAPPTGGFIDADPSSFDWFTITFVVLFGMAIVGTAIILGRRKKDA